MPKYIITTGGVMSGLGKGLVSASIGKILQSYGYRVTMVKIDPYVNIDAGTMNPFEHGEVFVMDDGGEVDMDLGTYERFLGVNLTRNNNITTGKVYKEVIDKERKGDYLGATVQIIPHVTNEIKKQIRAAGKGFDVEIIEFGGTVGDIESAPFLEAARQMHMEEGGENCLFIHVTLVPVMSVVGEQKTKPTQHSVQRLQEAGIQPDLIIARSTKALGEKTKKKISNFCNVKVEDVISDPDADVIYEVPLFLEKEKFGKKVAKKLNLKVKPGNMKNWKKIVRRMKDAKKTVRVGMAGKYTALEDSYISIREALKHAGAANNCNVEEVWIETTDFEKDKKKAKTLNEVDGLIVPGGFGWRGAEGKIAAIKYARENDIPFLGLCFGLQLASLEFARNVCGIKNATSEEQSPKAKNKVICYIPGMHEGMEMGATMRLGSWPCKIGKGTLARKIYKKDLIHERHRHRYELNPKYVKTLEKKGFKFSGKAPRKPLMEIGEIPSHPFFIGTQFHPEFKSRPEKPAPIFKSFVKACLDRKA